MNSYTLHLNDVRRQFEELPRCSVHTIVTSPPYLGLRDYGVDGQIGLEADWREHVGVMVGLGQQLRRVLRPDGTLWLNYGDMYAQGGKRSTPEELAACKERADRNGHYTCAFSGWDGWNRAGGTATAGLKAKDLVGMPWRIALALQEDGWWLRSDCIWSKANPMPSSVRDRPTLSHEYVFLLSRSARYYYDREAVRVPLVTDERRTERKLYAGKSKRQSKGRLKMKIQIEKNTLANALRHTVRVASNRSPLPILSHLLLEASDGQLAVSATNLDTIIRLSVPAEVTQSGSAACPAKLMSEIVGKLGAAPITLEVGKHGRVQLSSGRSKFDFSSLPAEEFPWMPDPGDIKSLNIPRSDLYRALQRILFATATNEEARAVLCGVLAELDGQALTLVSTDGRRLAWQHLSVPNPGGLRFTSIVPAKALHEVAKMLADTEGDPQIGVSEKQFCCTVGGISIQSRLMEGVFPQYGKVIPVGDVFTRFVRVGRQSLLDSIKRMLVVATDSRSPSLLVFELAEGEARITSNTPDVGSGSEVLPIFFDGEPIRVAFNGKYLTEALSALDCDEIEIDLQCSQRSGILSPVDDGNYKYVLMPVKLAEVVEEAAE